MASSAVPEALRARFVDAGQGHCFELVDRGLASAEAAAALVRQLSAIDVALVNDLFAATMAASTPAALAAAAAADGALEPCRTVTRLSASPAEQVEAWRRAGVEGLHAGHVAIIVLAGGQGTRLGSDRPKGEYDIGLPSRKSIFQLLAERALRVRDDAGAASLPVYVMTSPMTDADTQAFWRAHGFFGLPEADVRFFCQGTLPCLTNEGKIVLESAGAVADAPDGNGGIYRALHLSGCVADMRRRGVRGVHVFAVDNAIVKVADPVFVGFCLSRGADVGSKACAKAGPHEKVGVLCVRGGVHTVVEYSEMDRAAAELRDAQSGELVFNAGNICIHYYSVDFLADQCSPERLPKIYHLARKAIPYADSATGLKLSAEQMAARHGKATTGIKLESFIFDVFPMARNLMALEISREDEFAPVKNAPGSADDSPDTARALIGALHRRWLLAAGATIEGPADAPVEVSPRLSYAGEGLGDLKGRTLRAPFLVAQAGERAAGDGIETYFVDRK